MSHTYQISSFFLCFKQRTAADIVVGDWSSDGCSSDLGRTKKITNMVGSGDDYCPLLIAYDVDLDSAALNGQPNHWSITAWWDHGLTEEIMVHAAYGYIYINHVPRNVKHDYGHEVDAGVKAEILGSAELSSRFGYFIAGKYHRGARSGGKYAKKINNGWVWKNELILSF